MIPYRSWVHLTGCLLRPRSTTPSRSLLHCYLYMQKKQQKFLSPNVHINISMPTYYELKSKDIKIFKEKLHKQNKGICPLLGVPISSDKMALDHIHKLKSDSYATDKGTIRNAIEFRANAMEGKITNNWKRYYSADESKHPTDLPTFLRNLADYLEAGAYHEGEDYYIHPSEVPKVPRVKKSAYNKMIKLFKIKYPKKKVPAYPKSKKLTKLLDKLFIEFSITNFYYK